MQNVNDFARVQYIIDNYDDIEFSGISSSFSEPNTNPASRKATRNAETVRLIKTVDSVYYVVEASPITTRKTIEYVTTYMSKEKEAVKLPDGHKTPRAYAHSEDWLASNRRISNTDNSVKLSKNDSIERHTDFIS